VPGREKHKKQQLLRREEAGAAALGLIRHGGRSKAKEEAEVAE
jgi:hypothetical protein